MSQPTTEIVEDSGHHSLKNFTMPVLVMITNIKLHLSILRIGRIILKWASETHQTIATFSSNHYSCPNKIT